MHRRSAAQPAAPHRIATAARSMIDVPGNLLVLGAVSFFTDVSSEMIYPLVPIVLTGVVGAPVAAVGLIEGVAESTASLLKVGSGWWSDRVRQRLPLVFGGYGLAAVGKLLLAGAVVWPVALVARFIDRCGKGLRESPRDALIADSTPDEHRGRAFGLHRAMDTAGAALGPLLALLLVLLLEERLRLVFVLAAVPGALSVLTLRLVHEPRPPAPPATPRSSAPPPLWT
jgi:MFS family permease